jgi:fermentation-respiration switch protein FrsA (DUF1100 family)
MSRSTRSLPFRLIRVLFTGLAIVYLLITGAIWYAQTKILYHPSSSVDGSPSDVGVPFDNVALPLGGDRLTGWWIPAAVPQARTLLYLHGNAGNVAVNLDHALRLRNTGLNVFIIDYRGYGHSTGGPPRQSLLYEDAERAWRYLVAERNIPSAHIVIYGHSLGGSVAIYLASKHPEAGGLITESTYTSIIDMANRTLFRYLPLGLILTERHDSISRIGSIHVPKLFIHGDADNLIPPQMARRLYDAAPDPKQIAIIPGGGHDDSAVANPTAYFAALNAFLSQYHFNPPSIAAQ